MYISSFYVMLSLTKDVYVMKNKFFKAKYKIHELSARAIMHYAVEVSDGVYKYKLTEEVLKIL